jgi:hypothetical protein
MSTVIGKDRIVYLDLDRGFFIDMIINITETDPIGDAAVF